MGLAMKEALEKLSGDEIAMLMRAFSFASSDTAPKPTPAPTPAPRVELPPIDVKLDGPASYLRWSRRVRYTLVGRKLEGYLTGAVTKPVEDTPAWDDWRSIHMLVYVWLLNSMTTPIAANVDGMEDVRCVWEKLKKTYDGVGNNLRVYQVQVEIAACVQGERTVQEYAIELERLWLDHDYCTRTLCCTDPAYRKTEACMQDRTMGFLRGLAPTFEQRTAMLLAQPKIPSLEEAVSAMIQEETRIELQAGAGGLPGVKSALAVSNLGGSRFRGETRECYNCGEVGHLISACTKSPKARNSGGRGQSGERGRGRGRGRRGGGRGGYRANLMVAGEDNGDGVQEEELSAEDQELLRSYSQLLRRKGRGAVENASTSGNIATYAHLVAGTSDTHALASISTVGSPWIIDSGASRHVTGTVGEFSSYTHLEIPESIRTADGTAQPVVGKGTVRCTDSLTLSNVLHAPSFPVNLLSISAIILQLKCVVTFDIPKVIFQEKGTGRRLGTGTWRNGLWFLERKEMDSALASVVERSGGVRSSVEDLLLLYHR
ncbi:uncharacterized protein LOC124916252 [Impatiens glandulifera]|uniref:uncharacterized protein LOC124916252 n=1 Tax=Impatiens glandulifera TaxID=253017 RepID=UPI001FB116B1|nr:uncharacterized protein LOC124916252 [Impatiens glandulifera]